MKHLIISLLVGSLLLSACTAPPTRPADEAKVHFEQGNIYLKQGAWDKAITEFNKAINLNPELEAEALVGRGTAYAWAGDFEQAENDFHTAIRVYMGFEKTLMNVDAYVAWGIASTVAGGSHALDGQEAESLFDSAISSDPNNADAYTGRALMHLKEASLRIIWDESSGFSRLADALDDFEKAIALDPEGIQGRIKRFNFEGDMAFLPNYIEANKRFAAILVSTPIYVSNGLEEYDRVLKVAPNDVEALIGRGNIYMELDKYDLAITDFAKASKLAPGNPQTYAGYTTADQILFIQGNAYLGQQNKPYGKKWNEAITKYTKAIELNPEFAEAYANRAVAQLEQLEYDLHGGNEYNSVIADSQKAIELNPLLKLNVALARAYRYRGDYYFDHAVFEPDYNKAVADYTMAMKIDPLIESRRPVDVYVKQAEDYLFNRDYDEAIVYWGKVIELDSGNTRYYYTQLAEAYYGRGYYDHARYFERGEAIADYTRAIELDPTNAKYYLSRAFVYDEWAYYYYDAGQASKQVDSYNKAIVDYTKVIELDPINAAWVYGKRGSSYLNNEDYNKAIADYSRAKELGELSLSVYWGRAIAYEKLGIGNYDKALADYKKALELSDDDWQKEQILKDIEELEAAFRANQEQILKDMEEREAAFRATQVIKDLAYIKAFGWPYSDDADPEYEGVDINLSYYNSKSERIYFTGVPVTVTVELYWYTNFPPIYQKRVVMDSSGDSSKVFGGVLRIPFVDVQGRPSGMPRYLGPILVVVVTTPTQGDFEYRGKERMYWPD